MNQTYCPCPKCNNARTRVVLTKRTSDKVTIRRRWCPLCEHRWYSIQYPEVPVANQEIKWIGTGRNAKFIQSA
jgi:transcriptional regulator NrdR family protein